MSVLLPGGLEIRSHEETHMCVKLMAEVGGDPT